MTLTTLSGLAKICKRDSDKKADEGLPVLWQQLCKKHTAPDASREEWVAFVHQYENGFADAVSEFGQQWWASRDITKADIKDAAEIDFED